MIALSTPAHKIQDTLKKTMPLQNNKLVKFSCYIAIMLIILAFVWQTNSFANIRGFKVVTLSDYASGEEEFVVEPKFEGIDLKGRPYQIRANRAVMRASGQVNFMQPYARLGIDQETQTTIKAQNGELNSVQDSVNLLDQVELITNNNDHVYTSKAKINFKQHLVEGDAEVIFINEQSKLKAAGFRLNNDGEINLIGPIKILKRVTDE